ncbi:hypothetical protein QJS10_CPA05g02452 [Acorus calamus]|uniref:Uncharacterized protein n=1 Tax=Acorus calamus TaxID=4465 RepID=A0AAV9ET06_ACOCL|nr:hypothetical protein QJS10_CPA05g02452 [Acorus calamus]
MALLNPTRLTSLRRAQPLPSLWKTKKSSSVTVLCVPPQKQGSHSQEQEFDKYLVGKLASFYVGLSLVVAPPLSNNVR